MNPKLTDEKIVYKNYRTVRQKTFADNNGKETIFEITGSTQPIVVVIALTKENNIILVKEFRPGPNKTFTDLPSGQVDKGENIEDAAKRELMEETGYQSNNISILGGYYKDAYSQNYTYVLLATDCIDTQNKEEEIEVVIKPLEIFLKEFKVEDSINSTAVLMIKEI